MQINQKRRPMSEINVVPYIDVMLVLLVIFMVTAPLINQGITVQLPQASTTPIPTKQEEPIIVSVDDKGLYYLNVATNPTQPMAAADLLTNVAAQVQMAAQKHVERMILVKGDANVAYGKVVQAMVLLQQAGVPSVGLMTEPPQAPQG